MKKELKQFWIYNVDLNPTKGSEQRGLRPCILMQTNAVAHVAPTLIIIPLTSKIDKIYPYEIFISKSKINGLIVDSKAMVDQIRVIDKTRIKNKIGELDVFYRSLVFNAIDIIFDKLGDFR